jgi:hypothetical protein
VLAEPLLSVKALASQPPAVGKSMERIFARLEVPRKKQKPGNAGLLQSLLSAGLFRQLGDLMRKP